MGFLPFCLAGVGFILIGAGEAISSSSYSNRERLNATPFPLPLTHLLAAALSLLFIVNAAVAAFDSSDRLALPLQIQVIAVASLFLLHSLANLIAGRVFQFLPLPSPLLHLIALFAFAQEFLLFYLRRVHSEGLENRYYDLLLVPITLCLFSTLLAIRSPRSAAPLLGRAVGLGLQGTWFVQMGFSFYTNIIARGCSLHQISRGNYTVSCPAHMDAHRSKAIATLQFNCHLAFLLLMVVGLYRVFGGPGSGMPSTRHYLTYKPITEEMREMDNPGNFTLDSEEDEEISVEDATKQKAAIPVEAANGFGAH